MIDAETEYTKHCGTKHKGYYMDATLRNNVDSFLIRAVKNKYDGVVLVTGLEGTGKTTMASTLCKYVDPTFPGEPLNDGTPRRGCDRIVYTVQDIMKTIDNAKPEQAILVDEAVIGFSSQDSGNELQKTLIKKFVTIRKKRLYIFIIIPSLFLLRRYFAIFRTRAMIHTYSSDGVDRGFFCFYSHSTKRKLYVRGIKEFNQMAVKADFIGKFTNTENFFYDDKEYDVKKENAIKQITEEPVKKKRETSKKIVQFKSQRDILIYNYYKSKKLTDSSLTYRDVADLLEKEVGFKFTSEAIRIMCADAQKDIMDRAKEREERSKYLGEE